MAPIKRFLSSSRIPLRLIRLYVGLFAYGIAIALVLRAGLGGSPWDVLGQGIAKTFGLSFGTATIVISVVVLGLWIPLRQRPGWGTLSNAALIGVFADLGLEWLRPASDLPVWTPVASAAFLTAGLILLAFASVLYIGAGLGPGARDGLMTGLMARTGWPVWAVRSAIELTVTGAGWLLGGTVGLGTAVFAFTVGPLIQLALHVMPTDIATEPARVVESRESTEVSAGAGP